MTDQKSISQPTQITIPRLVQPRHRPSVVGTIGSLTRALIHSLQGPKSIALGLFLVLLTISGSRYLTSHSNTLNQTKTAETASDNNPISNTISSNRSAHPVALHTAQLTTVENTLTLTGTVVPDTLLRIAPSLSGLKITEMYAQPGDRITAGQPIAALDNSILLSQLAEAEAQLAQAESDLQSQNAAITEAQILQQAALVDANRYNILYEQGAISQEQLGNRQIKTLTTRQDVVTAEAAFNNAKANIARQLANIEQIETQLAQTTIISPATGTIAKRIATVGETTSGPLYSLIENNQLILEVNPSQAQLSQIELDAPVKIQSTDRATKDRSISLTGSVKSIEPILEASNRKATVKIALLTTEQPLRPGMFLQANIVTSRSRKVIIPAAAVITQPNGESIVYVAEKSTDTQSIDTQSSKPTYIAQSTSVEIAPYSSQTQPAANNNDNNYVQILSGLTANTQVVVNGANYLQPGDAITTVVTP
ncbi:MAG: efflux RND transporter periplasmic adaptor subunit [Cyanobacteria bacterium J06650_10]